MGASISRFSLRLALTSWSHWLSQTSISRFCSTVSKVERGSAYEPGPGFVRFDGSAKGTSDGRALTSDRLYFKFQ